MKFRNKKGQFIKGYGFWTGKKRPGLRTPTTFKKGNIPWNMGTGKPYIKKRLPKPMNYEIPCKCGCGCMLLKYDQRWREHEYITGHNIKNTKHSKEWKKKISQTLGNKRGWITPINRRIRNSLEYSEWRKKIFERDNYTCVLCKKRGTTLVADHILPFALYPNLRLVINNGRTLCKDCHLLTDTYGGRIWEGGGVHAY